MNSDFVLVKELESGVLLFWRGRGWWTTDLSQAKVYATRERVEYALSRMGFKNSNQTKYTTLEDLKER